MAILEVKNLTMRFGGLTAVNKVDFAVEKGEIFSIIGPNGAGKTTVFNAVTGVYAPTEGAVLFDGRDIQRPFRKTVVMACLLVGLSLGVGLALFLADIDGAWRAAIVLNTSDPGENFPARKALENLWAYLHARVMAEREVNRLTDLDVRPTRDGTKFRIRSTTNKAVLEEHEDMAVAEQRQEILLAMVNLAGSVRSTRQAADGRWHVMGPGDVELASYASREEAREALTKLAIQTGKLRWRLVTRALKSSLGFVTTPEEAALEIEKLEEAMSGRARVEDREGKAVLVSDHVLATFATRAEAEERLRELLAIGAAARRERVVLWAALFVGVLIGTGGAFAVWKRARRTPDVVARHGLARTFQNIRLFPDMLVVENVLMGMDSRLRTSLVGSALHTGGFRREETAAHARALELLRFVGLEERAHEVAKGLPYGDQRRLEMARALATKPKLVLLDEPAAGMNPSETSELMKLIAKIRNTGVTVVLIEHHMKVVMGISDRIVVLDYGSKIAEGTPADVKANPKVIEAYLGKEEVG